MKPVLVKIEVFTMNGSDGVYDGACFYLHDVQSVFSKASGSTIHDSGEAYDRACLYINVVVVCF